MLVTPKDTTGVPAIRPKTNMTTLSGGQSDNIVTPEDKTAEDTTATVPAAKTEMLSSKYAKLARQEQAIRAREEAIKAKEAALAAKEQEYGTSYVRKEELSKKFTENPELAIKEFGLSYDQLTQALLNQPGPESVVFDELKSEIKSLKEDAQREKQQAEEARKKEYERAIDSIRSEATQLVTSDPRFETIKEMDAVDAVVQHIELTYKEEGRVLKTAEAAEEVEAFLIEEALKSASLKKVKERQEKLAEEAAAKAAADTPAVKTQPARTLTNTATSSRKLTPKERAMLAFKGELK